MQVIEYKKAKRFVEACEDFRAATRYDAEKHVGARDVVTTASAADDVVAIVREVGGIFFPVGFDFGAVLAPLELTERVAQAAERAGDLLLAGEYRDLGDRMKVHVARALVESALGETTALERQLRASVAKNEIVPPRLHPSDVVESNKVVPLNGRSL